MALPPEQVLNKGKSHGLETEMPTERVSTQAALGQRERSSTVPDLP